MQCTKVSFNLSIAYVLYEVVIPSFPELLLALKIQTDVWLDHYIFFFFKKIEKKQQLEQFVVGKLAAASESAFIVIVFSFE